MMTEEERIEWFLKLQELTNEREQSDACNDSAERGGRRRSQHPKQLTEEQLQQILADDEMRQLVQQLGFAKRAFKYNELADNTPDVDAEWEKFAANHASQLDTLDEEKPKPRFHAYFFTHKVAASFIGVLLASGIAFAAIQIARNINPSNPQQPTTEQANDKRPATSLPADTIKAGTIPSEPYVFNNVPLDSMLTAIAAVHGVQVEFENEAARQLRFHFVWKRGDSLDRVIEKLNTFEAVNIGVENKKLVVR
ncbi:MAG: DUF4974 domain-containing protein [Bacteroidaceae bacterium]|nr:DUF4974 domain-containing protein [Bacteroidaceae bacterium]